MEALVMLGFFGCITLVSFILSAREESDPDVDTGLFPTSPQ